MSVQIIMVLWDNKNKKEVLVYPGSGEDSQGLFLKEDRSKLNLKRCQIIQAREFYVEKDILD